MSERFDFTGDELAPAYRAAVDAIEAGDLVVLPTDTVYGLAADAFKSDAVQRLLDAKGRGRDMPPPVLISVVESLDALATDVPDAGRKLCEKFWPGPLTVICHAQGSLMWDLGETQGTVALRVPDHENTRELLSRTGPLAVSSANKSGQPAALDVYDAEEQLADSVAVYLDGGEVSGGQPSTIVDITTDVPRVVRLGALSLAQLREVVPEITAEDTPADKAPVDATGEGAPTDLADNPADPTPTDSALPTDTPTASATSDDTPVEPADGKPTGAVAGEAADEAPAVEASAVPAVDEKPVDEAPVVPAVDETPVGEGTPAEPVANEGPVEPADGKPTGAVAGAKPVDETPAVDTSAVPAVDERLTDEALGVPAGDEKPTETVAGASKQDEKKPADPDVRPAD